MLELLCTKYRYHMACYLFLAVGRKRLEKIHASLRDLVEDEVLSGDDEPSNSEDSDVDVDVARAPVAPLVDGGVPVDQLDAHQLTDEQLLQRLTEACVPWSQPFLRSLLALAMLTPSGQV